MDTTTQQAAQPSVNDALLQAVENLEVQTEQEKVLTKVFEKKLDDLVDNVKAE